MKETKKLLQVELNMKPINIEFIPEDVLVETLSFLDIKNIEALGRISKFFQKVTKKDALWELIIKRDFDKFSSYYPEIEQLKNVKEISKKIKYKKILQFLLKVQYEEVNFLSKIIAKSGKRDPDSFSEGFDFKDLVGDKSFKTIVLEYGKIKYPKAKDFTLGDIIKQFNSNERSLDLINNLIVMKSIKRRGSQDLAYLNLEAIITRLTDEAANEIFLAIPTLEKLNLNACQLYSLPKSLMQLTCLKTLLANNNRISFIPKEIENLKYLEKFYITSNRIKSLPLEFFNLKELKKLGMGNFKCSGFECDCSYSHFLPCNHYIGKKIKGNCFQKLPPEIQKLEKLEWLCIDSIGLTELPKELGSIQSLQYINFSQNEIHDIPQEIFNLKNITSNKLLAFGNPVMQWVPLLRYQGKIKDQITMQQIYIHSNYCNAVGKILNTITNTPTNLIKKSAAYAVENPRKATSIFVGSAVLAVSALTYYYSTQGVSQPQEREESNVSLLFRPSV